MSGNLGCLVDFKQSFQDGQLKVKSHCSRKAQGEYWLREH